MLVVVVREVISRVHFSDSVKVGGGVRTRWSGANPSYYLPLLSQAFGVELLGKLHDSIPLLLAGLDNLLNVTILYVIGVTTVGIEHVEIRILRGIYLLDELQRLIRVHINTISPVTAIAHEDNAPGPLPFVGEEGIKLLRVIHHYVQRCPTASELSHIFDALSIFVGSIGTAYTISSKPASANHSASARVDTVIFDRRLFVWSNAPATDLWVLT
mmetsp:Transcript_9485/g.19272  ORF Transcript_9485/g.19272 Transcript_9485/m.19272 type:complete len:214 (-) Transcript_9485:1675-2316(-)